MSLIELTRSVCPLAELLIDDGFWLDVEPAAELPVAELPIAELPIAELPELDDPFSAQWPFTSTLWPSCLLRFLPSS